MRIGRDGRDMEGSAKSSKGKGGKSEGKETNSKSNERFRSGSLRSTRRSSQIPLVPLSVRLSHALHHLVKEKEGRVNFSFNRRVLLRRVQTDPTRRRKRTKTHLTPQKFRHLLLVRQINPMILCRIGHLDLSHHERSNALERDRVDLERLALDSKDGDFPAKMRTTRWSVDERRRKRSQFREHGKSGEEEEENKEEKRENSFTHFSNASPSAKLVATLDPG